MLVNVRCCRIVTSQKHCHDDRVPAYFDYDEVVEKSNRGQTSRIINSRCDVAAGLQVKGSSMLFCNAGFSRWTVHPTAQTKWQQVIFYSDIWRNVCANIDFQVTPVDIQADVLWWLEGQGPNFYLAVIFITSSKLDEIKGQRTQERKGDYVEK